MSDTSPPTGPSWSRDDADDDLIHRAMWSALRVLAPHGDPDDDVGIVAPLWCRLLTTGLSAALARGDEDPVLLCEQFNAALTRDGAPFRLTECHTTDGTYQPSAIEDAPT